MPQIRTAAVWMERLELPKDVPSVLEEYSMHAGLVMECDYREGRTQEEAFAEAFAIVEIAEECGLDGVWLAERHFAGPRRPTDPMGAGIPSIAAVPLVLASAIAARTQRLRIGTGVSVLPLCHPIRIAEEAATVDQISQGRLDFGIGRSGFPRAYAGYGVPYNESRERFQEALEVILKAWTQERFSHTGTYFSCNDLGVVPRPYQKPYPPIWVAATTQDTFPMVGRLGFSLVTGLRGFDIPQVAQNLTLYRAARQEAGHADNGKVYIRIPVYVAETAAQARSEPEESTMRAYRRLADNFARSVGNTGTTTSEERAERAARLSQVTYDDLLRDRVAYGTPDMVVERLRQLQEMLGLCGVIIESNVGGQIPLERVCNSIRLFAQEVAPRLRDSN
jgi:alkanesulfonate monooxygenase SsuD/methylene tetrahydromethanopterin reductase-like flavin-dependent oxidoreductase (luciferase family)